MERDLEPAAGVERRVTGHSGNSPGQGPFMEVSLCVVDRLISRATYETYQCPACHDCGKALCAMVKGKTVEEAQVIDRAALAARVGPLPAAKSLCYGLAVVALSDALKGLAKG